MFFNISSSFPPHVHLNGSWFSIRIGMAFQSHATWRSWEEPTLEMVLKVGEEWWKGLSFKSCIMLWSIWGRGGGWKKARWWFHVHPLFVEDFCLDFENADLQVVPPKQPIRQGPKRGPWPPQTLNVQCLYLHLHHQNQPNVGTYSIHAVSGYNKHQQVFGR